MTLADWGHCAAYLPLLDVCAAFQAGMFFRLYESRRAYIPVLIVITAYTGCMIWALV